MNHVNEQHSNTWPEVVAASVEELRQRIDELDKRGDGQERLAWRGHARPEWQLETTLDRRLREIAAGKSYEHWLAREKAVLERFKCQARPYASESELAHLKSTWTAMALGRHAGLPTRLLDWTWSPWVAAWFACHEHSDTNGVMWWFHHKHLEEVIHQQWDKWGVPTRAEVLRLQDRADLIGLLNLNERVLERTAFDPHGHAWVTKLHYRYPCPRMEAQQGFATVCGRLRKAHNDAIDELPDNGRIRRGRVVIAADIKGEVLAWLRTMNIHAKSLEYPGVDIVAREIGP